MCARRTGDYIAIPLCISHTAFRPHVADTCTNPILCKDTSHTNGRTIQMMKTKSEKWLNAKEYDHHNRDPNDCTAKQIEMMKPCHATVEDKLMTML